MKSLEEMLKMQGNQPQVSSTTSSSSEAGADERCEICGGLGYVRYEVPVGHPYFGKLMPCPAQHEQANEKRVERLREMSNLGVYAQKSFTNFDVSSPYLNQRQRESLQFAYNVTRSYAQEPKGWLVLEGGYGSGKTHLAAAVANVRLMYEQSVLFITTPDLLDHLRNTFGPNSEVASDISFEHMRTVGLLVLDDLGVENPSPWAQEKLFQLLNYRYLHQFSTIITTNVELDLLDARVRSRLLDENIIRRVRISVPDYRTGVMSQTDQVSVLSYFTDKTFNNFDVATRATVEERLNLERMLQETRAYAQQPNGWLMILGEHFANGKTHLAAAIANYCQEMGDEVLFIWVPDLLDRLKATFSPNAPSSFERRFNLVRNAPLLILDDLNFESASPWSREKLFQLVDYRYIRKMNTVFTTSQPKEKLDLRFQTRLLDPQICRVLNITARPFSVRQTTDPTKRM
jgi:DNA replication protein DnaC